MTRSDSDELSVAHQNIDGINALTELNKNERDKDDEDDDDVDDAIITQQHCESVNLRLSHNSGESEVRKTFEGIWTVYSWRTEGSLN